MGHYRCAALAAVAVVGFASIACAADMPVKAPPVDAPVAAYNWTGFYVGANIGGGWSNNRSVNYSPNDPNMVADFAPLFALAPPSASIKTSGVLGGLQLGYNWQVNSNWLVGLETDFDGSGIKGSGSTSTFFIGINPETNTVQEQLKWLGTVRARLGFLPMNNLLAFVTGGFAYGEVEHTGNYVNNGTAGFATGPTGGFSLTCNASSTCLTGSSSSVATGWTAGGGLEYAFMPKWTVKAEYLYVSLASNSVTETALQPVGASAPSSFNANYSRTNFNVARAGVNYRF
jgi:outer membrane immunogenic protein